MNLARHLEGYLCAQLHWSVTFIQRQLCMHILENTVLKSVPGLSSYCTQLLSQLHYVCPPMQKLPSHKEGFFQWDCEQRNANTQNICAFATGIYFVYIKKTERGMGVEETKKSIPILLCHVQWKHRDGIELQFSIPVSESEYAASLGSHMTALAHSMTDSLGLQF